MFVSGDVCTDGSVIIGKYRPLRRAGWALSQVAPAGLEKFTMYGPLPRPQEEHTIFNAELYALCKALQHAIVPVRMWSDCKNVVDGFQRGESGAQEPPIPTLSYGRGHGIWLGIMGALTRARCRL